MLAKLPFFLPRGGSFFILPYSALRDERVGCRAAWFGFCQLENEEK